MQKQLRIITSRHRFAVCPFSSSLFSPVPVIAILGFQQASRQASSLLSLSWHSGLSPLVALVGSSLFPSGRRWLFHCPFRALRTKKALLESRAV